MKSSPSVRAALLPLMLAALLWRCQISLAQETAQTQSPKLDIPRIERTMVEQIKAQGIGERFVIREWGPAIRVGDGANSPGYCAGTISQSTDGVRISFEFPGDCCIVTAGSFFRGLAQYTDPTQLQGQTVTNVIFVQTEQPTRDLVDILTAPAGWEQRVGYTMGAEDSVHRFFGRIQVGDYTFIGEGDKSERLTFALLKGVGYVYLRGKGKLLLKSGEEVGFPQPQAQARKDSVEAPRAAEAAGEVGTGIATAPPDSQAAAEQRPHPWWDLSETQAEDYVRQGRAIFREGRQVLVLGLGTQDRPLHRFGLPPELELVSVRILTPEYDLLMKGYLEEKRGSSSDSLQEEALRVMRGGAGMHGWPDCLREIGIEYSVRPLVGQSKAETSVSLQTDAGLWCGRSNVGFVSTTTLTVYAGGQDNPQTQVATWFSVRTPDGRLAINQRTQWVRILIGYRGSQWAARLWLDGSNKVELENTS